MLIECSECGKQISDKSEQCIHCGYPIKNVLEKNICIINNKAYDFSLILEKISNDEQMGLVIRAIRDICNMSLADAKNLYTVISDTQTIPHNYKVEDVISCSLNIPKCPTCQSTNVQKISTTERVGSVAMFGILSKKMNKTYKCKNCGYTW